MSTFTDHEVPGGIVRVTVEDAEAGDYRITALHGRARLIGAEASVRGVDDRTLAAIVGAIRVTIPTPDDVRYGYDHLATRRTGPCPCVCNSGGFCGGCGHAGCGRR